MNNEDRIYRNKLGQDPAHLVEVSEPPHGYGRPHSRFLAPSPVARKVMEECVEFAYFWRNDYQLSADRRWNRTDAARKLLQVKARCRELNMQLLREYLTNLRGEKKMRAYRTIENLKAQQT